MTESTNTTSHIVKNVTIGVITSVLAALLIYYTIGNPKKEEFAKKKAATLRAWKSYQQNKDIYVQVFQHMDTLGDLEATKRRINHEVDMTINNMENIKLETSADQRIMSAIDINIKKLREYKLLVNKYLDDAMAYSPSSSTSEEEFIKKLTSNFETAAQENTFMDSLRLNTIENDLIKEYKIE